MSETLRRKNPNLELIRILSMLMVIMLHTLDKGGFLLHLCDTSEKTIYLSWLLESLSVVCINLFMMVSGYVLVGKRFKSGRLLELIFETVFYGLGGLLVFSRLPFVDTAKMSVNMLFKSALPLHKNTYWFMTSYVLLYLVFPLLKNAIDRMSQKTFRVVLILLLVWESLFKSVLPIALENDRAGCSTLWIIIMFLIGAYIKLYGNNYKRCPGLYTLGYFVCALLVYAECMVIQYIYKATGRLGILQEISMGYNHIFTVCASIFLFLAFVTAKEIKGIFAKIVCFLSPMTLGVYLYHETPLIRLQWPMWFGIDQLLYQSIPKMLAGVLLTVILVFLAGCVADYIRIWIFKFAKQVISKTKISSWLTSLDGKVNKGL